MEQDQTIQELLKQLTAPQRSASALVGIDGYVDRIQRVVQSTDATGINTYYPTLSSFGEHVVAAAGKSTQVEIVSHLVKAGGNAPIMAQALARLGIPTTCLGTFGEPEIHTVFTQLDPACQLLSVGNPALTNAVEFDDGKLLLSEVAEFDAINWAYIKRLVGLEQLTKLNAEAGLLALVDWSNLPHATDIWRGVLEEIIQPNSGSSPPVFFDLCDLGKKTDDQIGEVLALLADYAQHSSVTLGLNANEATQLYHWLQRKKGAATDVPSLERQGAELFDFLGIQALLIHPIDSCYLFTKQGPYHRKGRLVANPLISTGGGDNFNAGYCFGMLQQFDPESCMELAMATSGAYVSSGQSPRQQDLMEYLKATTRRQPET